jgi:hypothetical protein
LGWLLGSSGRALCAGRGVVSRTHGAADCVWRVDGARLADGQPDVQGHWSNTIGNHNNFTDPQGGGPTRSSRAPLGPRPGRAPSRVSDPPSGEVPFQPWARSKAAEFAAHLSNPIRPEYVEPLARCAPAGPTKSFMWHGYEIRQFPGYVVFLFDSGTRVIPPGRFAAPAGVDQAVERRFARATGKATRWW